MRSAQKRLDASRREHESSAQELRIANEELQSINEEYRSTAEELETSKEELQSINEELQTVNSELKTKLDNVASAHSDLQNLINATEIGTLFLDADLRIKMLTPAVEQLFSVSESDVGRPITDFTHKLEYDGVENDARRVLRDLSPIENEVKTRDGRWLMMRLRPYRTVEDRIEGIVLSFVEITERRDAQDRLRISEERYRTLFQAMEDGFLLIGAAGTEDSSRFRFLEANPAADRMLGSSLEGELLDEANSPFEPPLFPEVRQALAEGKPRRATVQLKDSDRWLDLAISPLPGDRAAVSFRDVTSMKELEHRLAHLLEQSDR